MSNFQTFFPWHMKYLWNSRHLIITIKSNFTYVMKTSIYYFVIILSPKCCCIYNVCVIFRVLLLIDGFLLWEQGLRRISRHMLWVLFNTVLLILVKEKKYLECFDLMFLLSKRSRCSWKVISNDTSHCAY